MTIIKMVLLLISRCDVQCSAMLAKLQRGCNSFLEIAIFSTVKRKVIDWLHLAEQPTCLGKTIKHRWADSLLAGDAPEASFLFTREKKIAIKWSHHIVLHRKKLCISLYLFHEIEPFLLSSTEMKSYVDSKL